MRDLYWEIEESRNGEPYRIVAEGPPIGSGAEHLPPELLEAFNRYLKEFEPTAGTWSYQTGNKAYQVHFSPTARAPQI